MILTQLTHADPCKDNMENLKSMLNLNNFWWYL